MNFNTTNPLIALLAGMASFLSPCVFPLIPSYLSFVSGVSFDELKDKEVKKRLGIFFQTLFFVAGFSIIFILLGVLSTGIGSFLSRNSLLVNIVSGAVIILFGLHFIFDFIKILNFEKRFSVEKLPSGKIGALLLGLAFGAGWTPCIGPFLGSILFLASASGKMVEGVFLLFCYSLGLGIPFLLAGLFFSVFFKYFQKIKPHLKTIRIIGGIFLVIVGVLILLGRFSEINSWFFRIANTLESMRQKDPGSVRLLFGSLFGAPALLILVFYILRIIKVLRGKTGERENLKLVYPVRLVFLAVFAVLAALALSGTVDFATLIYGWQSYQGI
jgi:cytochrome c-type biogenesis protein